MLHPEDHLHEKAKAVVSELGAHRLVTTEMVLAEVFTYFAGFGPGPRGVAVQAEKTLRADANVVLLPQTSKLFREASGLYASRPDKAWSLTDCASFVVMEERGIREALAHDIHFEQAGFKALLK